MTASLIALLTTLVICLLAFTAIWRVHVPLKDVGIVDFYWGPGFAIIALVYLLFMGSFSLGQTIIAAATALWSIRLTWHLADRHSRATSEDRRYRAMRDKGGEKFWWRSLFTIFLLQGFIMWLIASPLHIALLIEGHKFTTSASQNLFWLGTALFALGFVIETAADYQLRAFKLNPANETQTLNSGLWAYSRHPNYFGESILWIGLGFMAFAVSGNFWAFAGPILLTFLLVKVSGVMITERELLPVKKGYGAYIASTSSFIPMPNRRDDDQRIDREPAE